MNYKKLSLEEKFGQMIMLGLDTYNINDEIIEIIKEYKIGGVILYKKNYTSLESMIAVVNKLKEANKENKIPLFIAVDQENGLVNRFPKDIINLYSPEKQAEAKDFNIVNAASEITTYLLKQVGVNMNLAPVLDINRYNNEFGTRCYGKTKEEVVRNAVPFMQFMQKNKIISVVKHFPGHGITPKDSHVLIPKTKDVKKLKRDDIKTFQNAINYGADAIMIDHLRIDGYGYRPASINKKILDDLLFKKYKYNGLVVCDDLRMGLMPYLFHLKKSIKLAIEAGNNLVIVKYKKKDKKMYEKLINMVKYCEIDPELIDSSAKKIMAMKKKYQLNDEAISSKINIEAVNEKIKKINALIDRKVGMI